MQTFLPYPNYYESAKVLDRQRLGKQRVEVKQILNSLLGHSKGWINHPAVKMWRGHEYALTSYGLAICYEWIDRGYKDSLAKEFIELRLMLGPGHEPPWRLDERIHLSHQSNLVRKDPAHYRQFFPDVPDNLAYFWPV